MRIARFAPARPRRRWSPIAAAALCACVGCLVARPAAAVDPAWFARRVQAALAQERLGPDQVSLVIRSSRDGATLYAQRPAEPMIPASNAKLVTSYAALRRLTQQFRWKTRFYLVTAPQDDPALPPRQGLLVESGGDPTMERGDLDDIAARLKALGVDRLDGPLWYDGGVFQGERYPVAWGEVQAEMPWYAPVTPFILNLNQASFAVTVHPAPPAPEPSTTTRQEGTVPRQADADAESRQPGGGPEHPAPEAGSPAAETAGNDTLPPGADAPIGLAARNAAGPPAGPGAPPAPPSPLPPPVQGRVEVLPDHPLPGMRVETRFAWIPAGREVIRVRELTGMPELTFAVTGELVPIERTFQIATAIADPVSHFLRQFRTALHEAGIEGDLPILPVPSPRPPAEEIYTRLSPPLGAVLPEMNKESNNLLAEVLLRSLALGDHARGVTGAEGAAVANAVMAEDFPEYGDQVYLVDGSGLSRDDRVSAGFLVALLQRVLDRFEFRAEFVNSLSVSGMDGTLLDRNLPPRYWGRLRAKTGTLKGVQNLSGYFQFGGDLLVLSFLIRDDSRDWVQLQRAQDRALTAILDAYLEGAAPPAAQAKHVKKPNAAPGAEPPAARPAKSAPAPRAVQPAKAGPTGAPSAATPAKSAPPSAPDKTPPRAPQTKPAPAPPPVAAEKNKAPVTSASR